MIRTFMSSIRLCICVWAVTFAISENFNTIFENIILEAMEINKKNLGSILLLTLLCCSGYVKGKNISLRCEYMQTPLCIDMKSPRLMWEIISPQQNVRQYAFQVWVASSPDKLQEKEADFWDSDKQISDRQFIPYVGKSLSSHTRYWWKVNVWDGRKLIASGTSWFETAKMDFDDWQASWITDGYDKEHEPSPYFRKEFTVNGKVASARLYISGLGYYESYLNGQSIGEEHLHPGFTDYSKRVLYGVHDVTELLKSGDNCLGVQLGNGWFNEQTPTVWLFDKAPWRKRPQLICELWIRYKDGREERILSDGSWHTSTGALLFDNIHVGVTYDARLEMAGWNRAGFDASRWQPVSLTESPAPFIETHKMPGIRYRNLVNPVSVKQINDTCLIYNMGINFAGIVRLRVRGERGTRIRLRHAELLNEQGELDQRNISMHLRPRNSREVIQSDLYILKGEGIEEFIPPFTYHGFQYVELTSDRPVNPKKIKLEGIVMSSGVEEIGSFECSDTLVNRIFDICRRSYLSNLFGIPTDCPTREKNGWMADGFMVQEAGMLSYDSRNVYAKWVKDMVDAQDASGNVPGIVPTSWKWDSNWAGPIWDAAIFMVPSLLYQYSGDMESTRAIYPTAKRYLRYLATTEDTEGLIKHGLGDWLYYKAVTPSDFMVSCYYYYDNILMARMARLLGKEKEATSYLVKARKLKAAINERYFDVEHCSYSNKTQLSYALPLYMGLVPDECRIRLAEGLNRTVVDNDYSLDFGFIGSLIVPDILATYGYTETVYKMLTKRTMPSWGYWIEDCDATTLFETWDVWRNIGDASHNHPSMGAIAAWMYKVLAGIRQSDTSVAFRHIVINPSFVKELDWVKASYHSQQGVIRSEWKRKGNMIKLSICIPAGAQATVLLPGRKTQEIGGGKYRFTINEE